MFIKTSYFFPSSSAARLGAGATWSMTHQEGKEREIQDTRPADPARQKHNCVKSQENKQIDRKDKSLKQVFDNRRYSDSQ